MKRKYRLKGKKAAFIGTGQDMVPDGSERHRSGRGSLFPQNADGRDARTDLTAKRTPKGRPSQLAGQEDYETAPIPNRIFTPVKSKKFWRYIPCISPNHMRRGLTVFIDIFFRQYMHWVVDTRIQASDTPSALNQASGADISPRHLRSYTQSQPEFRPMEVKYPVSDKVCGKACTVLGGYTIPKPCMPVGL